MINQAEWVPSRSFENMVLFYREELNRVIKTSHIGFLSKRDRRTLYKNKIVYYEYGSGGKKPKLNPEALRILRGE